MKLTNRKIWHLVIGLWSVVIVCMIARNFLFNEEKIVDAFLENNYSEVIATVEGFGQLNGTYLIEEERETLVKEVAGILGITKPYALKTEIEENIEKTTLCKPSKNGTTTISFQVKTEENENLENETQQFLSIDLVLYGSVDSGLIYGELLQQIFELYGIEGKVAVNYIGTIPGKLTLEKKNELGDQLLKKMSAKVVQEYRSEELFTIYGYTKNLDSYENICGKKMNVNIAITYDEEEDESRIYLATPYMMEDY